MDSARLGVRVVAGLLVTLTAIASAQEQQRPVFRGRLETVAVPVTVFDPYDELVTSLTREDFTVFDNGRRQDLTAFSSGLQPLRAVVLVDISASMSSVVDLAITAANQFIVRLRPDDEAKVGYFGDRTWVTPAFTSDRDALLKWMGRDLPFTNPTRLLDAVNEAITDLHDAVHRRVVIVFTDGCDTASKTGWSTVLGRIRAEDVMVYLISFRPTIVLKPPPQRELSVTNFGWSTGPARSTPDTTGCTLHHWLETSNATPLGQYFKVDDPRWTRGPQLITQLAAETGGRQVRLTPDDEINPLFTSLMSELHYMYLLGFTPEAADGKVHDITVRVKDKRLVVRARQHYVAPSPEKR